MANTPISGLSNGVTAQPGDEIPIARSGANYYITPSYIQTYILEYQNSFTALNTFRANIAIGQSSVTNGDIRFYNSTNSNYVSIVSGATGSSISYTLPTTAPTTGQVLSSTSAGVMSWVNNTAGSVNSGTAGRLAWYAATGTTISSNSNLFWDSSTSRFGIGTSSPAQAYDFYNSTSSFLFVTGDSATGIVASRFDNSSTAPRLGAQKSRGTRSVPLAVQSGDQVLSLVSLANNGSTAPTIAEISTFVDTFTSASDISSYMTFSTSPSGGTASTERMRIDKSGNVGIGTTSPAAIAGFTILTIDNSAGNGVLQLNSSGTSIGRIGPATMASGHTNGLLINNNIAAGATSGGIQFNISADTKLTISNTGTVALISGNNSATATNNLILGASTSAGTSAQNTLVLKTGTAPTTGPTATVQLYSSDRSANNTIPSFFTEGSGVTNAGITNTTVTNKIAMRINGTIYYLLATTNAT